MSRSPRNAEANRAVEFINLLSCTGQDKGKPFTLRPWQEEFVRRLFGTKRKDKRRQYTSAFLFLARRQGKSSLAAAIAVTLLFCGPPGQQILIASTNRKAAGHVYSIMVEMIQATPFLYALIGGAKGIYKGTKRIVHEAKGSFVEALSADASSGRGYNCSVLIFDELLTQKSRDLWNVLNTAQSSWDEPLTIALTTAGDDRHSLCWDEYDYAKRVAADPSIDPSHLPILFYAPEDLPWDEEKTWRLANPALGDYQSLDKIREECAKAKELPYLQRVFEQEHLNRFVDVSDAVWIPAATWAACKNTFPEGLHECYAGLDLSSTTDLTAFSLVFPHDGKFYLKSFAWVPEQSAKEKEIRDKVTYRLWIDQGWLRTTPGNAVDYDFLRRDIKEICTQYHVKQILFDRWNSSMLCQELSRDGLPMFGFGQGYKDISQPTKDFERLILGNRLFHDGNPVLSWCISNVVLESDAAENHKPNKTKSRNRIDCAVASIMAIAGAMGAQGAGAPDPIFDNRELLMSLLPGKRPVKQLDKA